ncbi:hypothetical protein ACTXGQ_02590 [Marinobacter sp. 1Y8]
MLTLSGSGPMRPHLTETRYCSATSALRLLSGAALLLSVLPLFADSRLAN